MKRKRAEPRRNGSTRREHDGLIFVTPEMSFGRVNEQQQDENVERHIQTWCYNSDNKRGLVVVRWNRFVVLLLPRPKTSVVACRPISLRELKSGWVWGRK